ncbi:hypothetical protein ACFWFX_15465 [Streptomyces roseolus]
MTRLPSLDDYDVQGVRTSDAAMWDDDVRYAAEVLEDAVLVASAVDLV